MGFVCMMLTRIFTLLLWSAVFLAPGRLWAQPTIVAKLPPRLVDLRGLSFDLRNYFTVPETAATLAQVVTPAGIFSMELLEEDAPRTVENFLTYVGQGAYRNGLFHRSVSGFVIQTGGFRATLPPVAVVTRAPITNEFRVPNTRGTVAMAKVGNNPNSATSQWFVNLGDNRANLDSQNGGFTVFARVLGDGMKVVDALAAVPVYNAGAALAEIPLRDIRRGQTNVTPANLLPLEEVFLGPLATRSSNPQAWSVSLDGSVLRIRPGPVAPRPATITVRAADLAGRAVTSTFVVKSSPARRYIGVGQLATQAAPVFGQIDVTPTGGFSGVWQRPGLPAVRARGSLDLVGGAELFLGPDASGLSLVLAYVPSQDLVRMRFRTNGQNHPTFDLPPVAWPPSAGITSPLDRTRANVLLDQGASGFLQLTFGRFGQARLTGRLADNNVLTGSFPAVTGDATETPLLPIAVFPARGTALSLTGALQIDLPGQRSADRASLRGTLRRLVRGSDTAADLAAVGAFWSAPLPGANALSGSLTAGSYRLLFQDGLPGLPAEFAGEWPFSNRPVTPKGSTVAGLSFSAATGLFSGRVALPTSPANRPVSLPFFGVLTGPLIGLDAGFRGAGFVAEPAASSAVWSLFEE